VVGSGGAATTAAGRRPSFTGRAALLALVLTVLGVSFAYPLRTWLEQRSELAALHAERARLELQVADLEDQRARWKDPAYIRQQARERLAFVLPGETGYIVIDGTGETVGEAPARSEGPVDPAGSGPWWDRLWGSVQAAGSVPAPESSAEGATAPSAPVTGTSPAPSPTSSRTP